MGGSLVMPSSRQRRGNHRTIAYAIDVYRELAPTTQKTFPPIAVRMTSSRAYWSAKFLTVTHGSKTFGQREVRLERAKARAKLALARHHCAM